MRMVQAGEEKRERRLLFIAYYYPPSEAIGAVRAERLARHLKQIGWEVVVVTQDRRTNRAASIEPDLVLVSGLLDTIAGFFPGKLKYQAKRVSDWLNRRYWLFWCRKAYARVRSLGDKFDIILATGSPFISFELARKLSRDTGVPFVNDYRDPWIGWGQSAEKEREIMADAAASLTVSPSLVEYLQDLARDKGKVHLLTNGFDNALGNEVLTVRAANSPDLQNTILYPGRLYPPRIVLTPLLEAIEEFNSRTGSRMRLHYCGPSSEYALSEVRATGTEDLCDVQGSLPRSTTLSMQARAMINCVICGVDIRAEGFRRGILTGKLFDCLSVERPILIIAPENSDVAKMFAGRPGVECVPAKMDRIVEAIGRLRNAKLNAADYEEYSWSKLSHMLDGLLMSILKKDA